MAWGWNLRPGSSTPVAVPSRWPWSPGGQVHRASRDGVGRIPPSVCEIVQPVRGWPWWGHAPQGHPPGERGLPSILGALEAPPEGAGGLKVAEPLLAVTPQGLSCWQAVLAVHPGASARSWQVKHGGVLGGQGVARSYNMHSIGGRAGGDAGTTLEACRWGPASLRPPTWRRSRWCSRPKGPQRLRGACSPDGSGHGSVQWA